MIINGDWYNYDNFLISLDAQTTRTSQELHANSSSFCQGKDARDNLINTKSWSFDYDSENCNYHIVSSNTMAIESGESVAGTVVIETIDNSQNTVFSIIGGNDKDKFNINELTGVLSFKVAPSYSTPTDANSDNVYRVQVKAIDTADSEDVQTVKVTVTNGSTNIVPIINYLLF